MRRLIPRARWLSAIFSVAIAINLTIHCGAITGGEPTPRSGPTSAESVGGAGWLEFIPLDSFIVGPLRSATGSIKLAHSLRVGNVRRIVVLADPFPGGNVAFFPAVIVQFNADLDAPQGIVNEVWKDARTAELHGKTYVFSKTATLAGAPLAACVCDKRTVLVAPESSLRKMLDAGEESSLRTQLRKADLNHDIVVQHSGPALVARITKVFNVPIERLYEDRATDESTKVFVRDIRTISLSIDLSGERLLRLDIVAANGEAAQQLAKQIDVGLDFLKQRYPQLISLASKHTSTALIKPADEVAKQMIESLRVTTDASHVSTELAMPKSWADLIQALAESQKGLPSASER
jgi:hypothetical protein